MKKNSGIPTLDASVATTLRLANSCYFVRGCVVHVRVYCSPFSLSTPATTVTSIRLADVYPACKARTEDYDGSSAFLNVELDGDRSREVPPGNNVRMGPLTLVPRDLSRDATPSEVMAVPLKKKSAVVVINTTEVRYVDGDQPPRYAPPLVSSFADCVFEGTGAADVCAVNLRGRICSISVEDDELELSDGSGMRALLRPVPACCTRRGPREPLVGQELVAWDVSVNGVRFPLDSAAVTTPKSTVQAYETPPRLNVNFDAWSAADVVRTNTTTTDDYENENERLVELLHEEQHLDRLLRMVHPEDVLRVVGVQDVEECGDQAGHGGLAPMATTRFCTVSDDDRKHRWTISSFDATRKKILDADGSTPKCIVARLTGDGTCVRSFFVCPTPPKLPQTSPVAGGADGRGGKRSAGRSSASCSPVSATASACAVASRSPVRSPTRSIAVVSAGAGDNDRRRAVRRRLMW